MTTALRGLLVTALIVVTVTLQVSIFSHFAVDGVAPDLALLLVIGAALVRGPTYASLVGFAAGLVLDLAPPADHTAGRWALALVVVGYLTGLAKPDGHQSVVGTVLIVASGAFIGTSLFALSGLALGEQSVTVTSALQVVPLAILYDVVLTPFVVPLLLVAFRRLEA
ncbi:MAG: rod shape-determining protein MreD, partial [Actinomycetota bacterium]|nr:rod shape-determining protein MreD [Actinomycetota bacterium]